MKLENLLRESAKVHNFENIYHQYYKQIYNYIYGQCLHREIAEDVASDVFVAAWKNLDSYDPERGSLTSWLFTIARNLTENWRQKASSRHEVSVWDMPENSEVTDEWHEQDEGTLKNPINRRTYRILEKLTEQERYFLSLRYTLDMNNEEIANLMNLSVNAISHRYSRLLAKCRRIDEENMQ